MIFMWCIYVHIDRTDVWHRRVHLDSVDFYCEYRSRCQSHGFFGIFKYCLRSGREPCPVCAPKKTWPCLQSLPSQWPTFLQRLEITCLGGKLKGQLLSWEIFRAATPPPLEIMYSLVGLWSSPNQAALGVLFKGGEWQWYRYPLIQF